MTSQGSRKMIELFITVFDGNYKNVLDEDNSWFLLYKSSFISKKTILVNDISDIDKFNKILNPILKKHNDISVKYVHEFSAKAKIKFKLNINEQTKGYYYAIQYFVAILLCEHPYLFNVSSDCKLFFEEDFLLDSISELKRNKDMITTTLPWSNKINVGLHEQNAFFKDSDIVSEQNKFYYSYGFSDQVFFADTEKLRKIDFNIQSLKANYYPTYGGECFEKRMAMYHMSEYKFRGIYNKYYYLHDVKPLYKRINAKEIKTLILFGLEKIKSIEKRHCV